MFTTIDDVRVTFSPTYNFNGSEWVLSGNNFTTLFNNLRNLYNYDTDVDFGLIAVSVESEQLIPFATSKSINTTQSMYKEQNIITAVSGEPITLNLTLCPVLDPLGSKIPVAWENEMWNVLYRLLDVRDYKPLIFGNPNRRMLSPSSIKPVLTAEREDYVSRPYYNCIPLVGSVSELKLFENSQGYVTIPFQCDAPHMWIDVQKTYDRTQDNGDTTIWYFPNFTNVKDYSKEAKAYPIIDVYDFISDQYQAGYQSYVSFTNNSADIDTAPWFRFLGFINTTTLDKVVIDNYNKQIYGFDRINNKQVLNDTNYIECLQPIRFFFLEEEGLSVFRTPSLLAGGKDVYHRTYMCENTSSAYKIKFFYSCPYMGGNEDGFFDTSKDNHTVMGENTLITDQIEQCKREIKDMLEQYRIAGIIRFGNPGEPGDITNCYNAICRKIDAADSQQTMNITLFARDEHSTYGYIVLNISSTPLGLDDDDTNLLGSTTVINCVSGVYTRDSETPVTAPSTLFYNKKIGG